MPDLSSKPYWGLWWWRRGLTVRAFGWLFQMKCQKDELCSQRRDPWRVRVLGLSIKMFGS